LLEPDGGSLLEPPLIEITSGDGDRQLVDYTGAYSEDGKRAAPHELWCLALAVQGSSDPSQAQLSLCKCLANGPQSVQSACDPANMQTLPAA
jgi:hypothetical protein